METYQLKHDIKVFCVEAQSFPKGIKAAFDKLYSLLPNAQDHAIFGISKPENGIIKYRAAANENIEGQARKLGYPTFIIEAGEYLGETLMDWQQNEMMIMSIFNRLIADKRLDGSAHCIEWYKSPTELLCMVLMKPEEQINNIKVLPL
jgi:hypothetical protein